MRDQLGLEGGMRTAGVERVIAQVLLWGGLLGGLLVVLGLILFAGRGGFERPVLEVQRLDPTGTRGPSPGGLRLGARGAPRPDGPGPSTRSP